MDNTTLNAFLPFLATILAAIIPKFIEVPPSVKKRATIFITTVVAAVAITFVFSTVSDSAHCAVTNLSWYPYHNDGLGSTITVSPVQGSNCAIQISFDLKQGGYVAIYKKLGSELLAWWIDGIEFSYSGMGNPNTIEFKLVNVHDIPYKAIIPHSANTNGKNISVSIPYGELRGPNGEIFKRDGFSLDRIDFSFSSWTGDNPGPGNIIIDDIRFMLSWKIQLIIFSPIILVIGLIVKYSLWEKQIKK